MFIFRDLLMHFVKDPQWIKNHPIVLNSIVMGLTVLKQKNRILNSSGTVLEWKNRILNGSKMAKQNTQWPWNRKNNFVTKKF
jgi:hypothetical protein